MQQHGRFNALLGPSATCKFEDSPHHDCYVFDEFAVVGVAGHLCQGSNDMARTKRSKTLIKQRGGSVGQSLRPGAQRCRFDGVERYRNIQCTSGTKSCGMTTQVPQYEELNGRTNGYMFGWTSFQSPTHLNYPSNPKHIVWRCLEANGSGTVRVFFFNCITTNMRVQNIII